MHTGRPLLVLGLLWIIPLLAVAAVTTSVEHDRWSKDYDGYFKKYTKHYFGPLIDWRWFKAQGIAESGLNPRAESRAGAKGIMQILPSTYAEIKTKNPHFTHVEEPRWNIAAGIYYDRALYRKWQQGIPTEDRLSFAFASYNAGYGNVRKAYRKAENALGELREWEQLAPYLPGQTRHYVRRIARLMQR